MQSRNNRGKLWFVTEFEDSPTPTRDPPFHYGFTPINSPSPHRNNSDVPPQEPPLDDTGKTRMNPRQRKANASARRKPGIRQQIFDSSLNLVEPSPEHVL